MLDEARARDDFLVVSNHFSKDIYLRPKADAVFTARFFFEEIRNENGQTKQLKHDAIELSDNHQTTLLVLSGLIDRSYENRYNLRLSSYLCNRAISYINIHFAQEIYDPR